ncbi:heme peroxidase [Spinellus fusiger]|nr:heme peroxidase [Spinellus fusiger]
MFSRQLNQRIRSKLTTRALLPVTGISAAASVQPVFRAAPLLSRGYASEAAPKKGSSNLFLTLGLASLGGVAGYYYHTSNQVAVKKTLGEEKKKPIDYVQIYKDIADILDDSDYDDGSYGPVFFRLAWHSSGTYDKVTKTGGSNGATMRFSPESNHGANNGLDIARNLLEKIHAKHPDISYGDLWTLAAVCSIQEMGGPTIPWRAGREDALSAQSCTPEGRLPDGSKKEDHIRDIFYRMGFNDKEIVALVGGGHTVGRCHAERSGFEGPWNESPTLFNNEYFKALVEREWVKKNLANGGWQWVAKENPDVMMLPAEFSMFIDKEFKKYFLIYAKDEEKFFEDFKDAFKKLIELGVPFDGTEKEYKFKTLNV